MDLTWASMRVMTWLLYKRTDALKVLCIFFREFHPFHVDAPVMEGKSNKD
jgi:hypothetical protein